MNIIDPIKLRIPEKMTDEEVRKYLLEEIPKVNNIIPEDTVPLLSLVNKHPDIGDQVNKLIILSEQYKVATNNLLVLRKNLIRIYFATLDYCNLNKTSKWLMAKLASLKKDLPIMSMEQKSAFAYILFCHGFYEELIFNHSEKALNWFYQSKEVADSLDDINHNNLQLKCWLYISIAKTLILKGDIGGSEKYIEIAKKYIHSIKKHADWFIIWYVEAMCFYEKGLYQNAMEAIIKNTYLFKNLPYAEIIIPSHMLQIEILLKLNRAEEAHQIIKNIHDSYQHLPSYQHKIIAKILFVLAKTELTLDLDTYKEHLKEARETIEALPQNSLHPINIKKSKNYNLAHIYGLEGDAAYKIGDITTALYYYELSYVILCNRYGNHLKNETIGLVLNNIIIASIRSNNIKKALNFFNRHDEVFGPEHPRTQSLYGLIEISIH